MLKIGISMRVVNAPNYHEPRDAIAKDWYRYFEQLLPGQNWLLLPNIEERVTDYIENWGINAFILSGGEDIGSCQTRDHTEQAIFHYAQKNNLPILGICRGFQLIYTLLGGKVERQDESFANVHRAKRHDIIIGGLKKTVNSYHDNLAILTSKPDQVGVLATCAEDNSLEAFTAPNILSLLWHPEREENFQHWDAQLIKQFFGFE